MLKKNLNRELATISISKLEILVFETYLKNYYFKYIHSHLLHIIAGNYLYTEGGVIREGDRARITFSSPAGSGENCATFWYHATGRSLGL